MENQNRIYNNYMIIIGGTSVRQGLANSHLHFIETLYKHGKGVITPRVIVPAMDQANPDIKLLQKIDEDDAIIFGAEKNVSVIRLFDRIEGGQGMQEPVILYGEIDHPINRDNLFHPSSINTLDLTHGYCANQSVGAGIAPQVFEKAVEDADGRDGSFGQIIDQVINSNENQAIHVILMGPSSWGGEGRTHTNILPNFLFDKCVEMLVSKGRMTRDMAEQHVREHLLIDVIMHGSYFRFPALDKDKDVKRLTRETLANFDPFSAEHINTFALVEHDLTCVLAEKPSEYGNQHRHAHAAELVAYSIAKNCMQEPYDGKRNVIPHYAVAGPQTNWSTLGVPEELRRALTTFLRYYAVLEYFLEPQLGTCLADVQDQDLYNTRIAALAYRMYGGKLREARDRDVLEKEILAPFWTMYRRARTAVQWIRDISLTGRNWQTNESGFAEKYTSLFNVPEIERLLGIRGDRPRIDQFQLDSLSECGEGNLASTGMTLDDVILKLKPAPVNSQHTFMDMMMDMYEIVRI